MLGKGGFARVYKAVSKHTRAEVAIKKVCKNEKLSNTTQVDRDSAEENGCLSRVQQEVEIHLNMEHESIVTMHHYFYDQKYIYIVMEVCEGGDFLKMLKYVQP
jgi:polo-like kinase 4